MNKRNSTFCAGQPTWTNACVGNNGSPSYVEYAIGFSKAANLIIDQVLKSRNLHLSVDEMVYPVCFNMRHSVELRLKGAIEALKVIAKCKGKQLSFDFVGSHNIGNIWSFFKNKSEIIDERFKEINDRIEPTILDLADVDATGQTFRYPINTESQKHLTDISIINFIVLKEKFGTLEEELDKLLHLTNFLIEEYSLGSFTNKLSRCQLFILADELPPISSWICDEFVEIKNSIREKFSLSSNDLSKAIDLIKSNYELSFKINKLLPLKGVDEYILIWFLDFWMQINPEILSRQYNVESFELNSSDILVGSSGFLESLTRDSKIKGKFKKNLNGYLTAESLAGLKALFYFAHDKMFSETYVSLYKRELEESKSNIEDGIGAVWDSLMHLADKTNFFDNLVISLYFLNYSDLAEELMQIYGTAKAFPWIEKARSRELYRLPNIAGYA